MTFKVVVTFKPERAGDIPRKAMIPCADKKKRDEVYLAYAKRLDVQGVRVEHAE